MKNYKKNKQKIHLQKGGAENWNEWFKQSKIFQGPYNSFGIEKMITIIGNFFSGWGTYFTVTYLYYTTFFYRKSAEAAMATSAAAASAGGQMVSSVTTSVIDVANTNLPKLKKISETLINPLYK